VIASGEYQVVFDVAEQGYQAWKYALLPALAAAAITLVWTHSARRAELTDSERRNAYLILRIGTAIVTAFSAFLLFHTWSEYEEFVQRLRSGDYLTVTGPITNFQPGGVRHRSERFRVNGTVFTYGPAEITSAFHHTAGHGGPMREGLQVRLAVAGDRIIRVEVRARP